MGFIKNGAIYLSSTIVSKAIPFLLLPILTKYLSPEEYGLLALFQVFIAFGLPFIGMNSHSVISRNFFKRDKEYNATLIFNLIIVITLTALITFLILSSFLVLFKQNIFGIPNRWVMSIPLLVFFNMINNYCLTVLRNSKQAFQFGFFEISRTTLNLSISIILVVFYSYNWFGRLYGIYLASIIMGIFSIIKLYNLGYLSFKFNRKQIKEILLISIPLIPHVLGSVLINMSDRLFIQKMCSSLDLGVYTVGYQFGMIMSVLVLAVSKVFSPWIYENLVNENMKNKIVKSTYLIMVSYLVLALIISVLSSSLLPIMTPIEYHSGIDYIIWITFGFAFFGMYNLMFPYGVHVGSTKHLGIITFLIAILNMILNYLLIKLNGPIGAAQSTFFSFFLMFIFSFIYANKLYPMPWLKILKK
jgi:O-antigen/teichoic acid export membrane protein